MQKHARKRNFSEIHWQALSAKQKYQAYPRLCNIPFQRIKLFWLAMQLHKLERLNLLLIWHFQEKRSFTQKQIMANSLVSKNALRNLKNCLAFKKAASVAHLLVGRTGIYWRRSWMKKQVMLRVISLWPIRNREIKLLKGLIQESQMTIIQRWSSLLRPKKQWIEKLMKHPTTTG